MISSGYLAAIAIDSCPGLSGSLLAQGFQAFLKFIDPSPVQPGWPVDFSIDIRILLSENQPRPPVVPS